jgi:DNA-binding transcriptional MerR regulator
MRIGEVGRQTGLKPGAIRYYESIGLLPEPQRDPSGYRRYGEDVLERLRFVNGARSLGLSLEQIRDVLAASAPGHVRCEHVVRLLEAHRDRIDEWIRGATALRDALEGTIASSAGNAGESSPVASCPVVERGMHERALRLVGVTGAQG